MGRWESRPSEKGNVTGVVFKADSSFEGYVNKKPFVTGRYSLQDDVFTWWTTVAMASLPPTGSLFSVGADSMRFTPIIDSCERRKDGMSKLVNTRVK